MGKEETRFTLRIAKEVFDKVKAIAEEQGRSAAKQIEYILKSVVDKSSSYDDDLNVHFEKNGFLGTGLTEEEFTKAVERWQNQEKSDISKTKKIS